MEVLDLKENSISNLVSCQRDINKLYLYTREPYEGNYQLAINKRTNIGLKHFNVSKAFIEYSNDVNDIYKNIEE